MHELVKKYLDEGKAKEQEILDEEARKKKEERDNYLIRLGLTTGTERRYSKEYSGPYCSWDKEKEMYYYDAQVPVEVTDEEFEEIRKYEKFHNGEIPVSAEAKATLDNGAESTLSVINSVFYILAWIVAFTMFIVGLSDYGYRGLIKLSIILILGATITWAVVKVYINISNNLHELNAKIKKQ